MCAMNFDAPDTKFFEETWCLPLQPISLLQADLEQARRIAGKDQLDVVIGHI